MHEVAVVVAPIHNYLVGQEAIHLQETTSNSATLYWKSRIDGMQVD